MIIDTEKIISITEANQNFSKAAKKADDGGAVYIFKNNKPKYKLSDVESEYYLDLTEDEIIRVVSDRVLAKYKDAYMELAK